MKNVITLFLVCLTIGVFAQTEGEIIYVTNINIHKQLKGDRAEDLKKMLPETQSFKQVLYFNESASLFHKFEEEKDVDEADLQGGRSKRFMMRMMGGGDNDRYFVDLDDETIVQQRDFLGKTFLIKDDIEERKWKLGKERKMINGYMCFKAELQIEKKETKKPLEDKKEEGGSDESGKGKKAKKEGDQEAEGRGGRGRRGMRWDRGPKSIVAWYTPQIPVSAGPSNYSQLPGMVLQVEIDGTNNVITAEKITLKELDKGTIEKPKKGKKVTREEFNTIRKEKMEEMRKERGGKGGRGGKIRIQKN